MVDQLKEKMDTFTALVKEIEAGVGQPSLKFEKLVSTNRWSSLAIQFKDYRKMDEKLLGVELLAAKV